MITKTDILNTIYKKVTASDIPSVITGDVSLEVRATDSIVEDCVISVFLENTGKFIKAGVLIIKIFYIDIEEKNSYYEDTLRGATLESLLSVFSETLLKNNIYSFEKGSRRLTTEAVMNNQGSTIVNQHYAILTLNFKILIS